MKLLKFDKIRIPFQVNSKLTERGENLLRNYCMQQNVVEWRDSVRFAISEFVSHYRVPVTSALVVTDHPKMTDRKSMLCSSRPTVR